MQRLLLVDGHNVLYRAFFAFPPLTTRAGVHTNAVFGFVKMLRQLLDVRGPTHLLVVLDGGVPAERSGMIAGYKANRKPMPDDLRPQVGLLEKYMEASGTAWLRVPGEEADDVMASAAVQWHGMFQDIILASSDKDLLQVVCDGISVVPVTGKANVSTGPCEVREKTGVVPGQIVDWLAMAGDAADNVRGIDGVGPKKAAKLLSEFGTVDGVYGHIEELKPGVTRDAIVAARDRVYANREAMRLRTGICLGLDPADAEIKPPDRRRLVPLLEELEFNSMAAELRQCGLFPGFG
ncbi:MAG: hypothetical protein FJ224_00285 [Lentisphaerae bacterium]|nr:hypothetical protein [Lentisphaerota bacterium]